MINKKLIKIDIIILSYAKNDKLKKLTEQTITTCLNAEDVNDIKFNIVVVESNKSLHPYQFENTNTIYPEVKFGFNRYLNIGIKNTSSEYICFCNNDLIFHKNWASKMLKAMEEDSDLVCTSTFCPTFHKNYQTTLIHDINYGYQNGVFFSGWCFMVKRSVFKITGLFDEQFEFWFSDDDFRLTLKKHRLKNALVKASMVTHKRSETLDQSDEQKKMYLKYCNFAYYKYKWQHHNFFTYLLESLKYRFKIIFTRY